MAYAAWQTSDERAMNYEEALHKPSTKNILVPGGSLMALDSGGAREGERKVSAACSGEGSVEAA